MSSALAFSPQHSGRRRGRAVPALPNLDFLENVGDRNAPHSPRALVHRNRVVFARIAVRIDHQIVIASIRPDPFRVHVSDEADHGSLERYRHVQRAGVRRKHEGVD
jgi:hypothetical protein